MGKKVTALLAEGEKQAKRVRLLFLNCQQRYLPPEATAETGRPSSKAQRRCDEKRERHGVGREDDVRMAASVELPAADD